MVQTAVPVTLSMSRPEAGGKTDILENWKVYFHSSMMEEIAIKLTLFSPRGSELFINLLPAADR